MLGWLISLGTKEREGDMKKKKNTRWLERPATELHHQKSELFRQTRGRPRLHDSEHHLVAWAHPFKAVLAAVSSFITDLNDRQFPIVAQIDAKSFHFLHCLLLVSRHRQSQARGCTPYAERIWRGQVENKTSVFWILTKTLEIERWPKKQVSTR